MRTRSIPETARERKWREKQEADKKRLIEYEEAQLLQMKTNKTDQCSTCVYYMEMTLNKKGGECFRFPPRTLTSSGDHSMSNHSWTNHQSVEPIDWCGEFKKLKGKVKA